MLIIRNCMRVNILKTMAIATMISGAALEINAAPDPNFHIYLCIGQSNMEGNASIEPIDRQNVPERFKVMSAVDYKYPARTKGEWYVAVPPLVRENTGLTPIDYFGRTMVANLPEEVTVGVIPVAVGGCRIEHLDKDYDPAQLSQEADWFRGFMSAYDNKPYDRLLECARKAAEVGVIKGILLHQGESNNGDRQWPTKVKKVYDDILADLGLEAGSIPLLAGEVVRSDQGGVCGGMNDIIRDLPSTLPQARVVTAAGLPQKGDGLHFTAHAYRVLGCRYATEMLATMGITDPKVDYSEDVPFVPTPEPSEGDFVFDFQYFNPKIFGDGTFDATTGTFQAGQWGFGGWEYDRPIDLSGYKYIVAELKEGDKDNAELRVFDTSSYWEKSYEGKFNGGTLIVAELSGMMKNLESGIKPVDTSKIYRVGFWGHGRNPIHIKHVYATNVNPYDTKVEGVTAEIGADGSVYNLLGMKVSDSIGDADLEPGIYISAGRKFVMR